MLQGLLLEDTHQRRALLSDMNSVSAIVGLLSSPSLATQQNASAALAALSQEASAREVLYRLGTLSHVIRSLSAANVRREDGGSGADGVSDDAARVSMLRVVAAFAADERYRTSLAETGGLGSLTPLLSSHLPHVQQCALSAIANVSFVPGAVNQLASSGALSHLGQMLFGAAEADGKMVLTAITNILSSCPSAAEALTQVGGHMALITQVCVCVIPLMSSSHVLPSHL